MSEKPKIRRKSIPFNIAEAYVYLKYNKDVFTLRHDDFPDRQHNAIHNKKVMFVVNVRFIKTVEISKTCANAQLLICENPQDLKPFYKESGFDMIDDWVNAILRYPFKWQCNETKTFNLYYVFEHGKYPLSSVYLKWLQNRSS